MGNTAGIAALDWVVIGIYFAIVADIAGWAIRRERSGRETSAGCCQESR
ncbi:MAG TPA: hypothetical protein VLU25_20395 [Acidobacteriota bacterium]|nr:hypothetical protein [Acidobacteriota bacterium]